MVAQGEETRKGRRRGKEERRIENERKRGKGGTTHPCKLENLGGEIFEDGGDVDGG
jgi:hypothetical protein